LTAVVDGLTVTRQQAGLLRVLDLLFAAFGMAGDEELESFLELKKEGAQGALNIAQFKVKIQRLYKSLLPVGRVQLNDHKRVFISGLTQAAHRTYAKQLMSFSPNATLEEIAQAVITFEQEQKAEKHLDIEVSVRTKSASW